MTRLCQGELEHAGELVTREAAALLMYAQLEQEKLDAARAVGDEVAERIALHRLARIGRQLTRAQAVLVHPDDPRHDAALAVVGYCDEADQADRLWRAPLPPLQLGVAPR